MNEERYRAAEQALFADAGIDPNEHWVDLRTIGTTARVLEVGHGLTVVFFTGGPMAAATWSYVAGHTNRLRCILVERPGTGLSDPLPAPVGVDRFPGYLTDLVGDVLDGLGLDRVTRVGSSLGGAIALRAAAAFPDRIDRFVLAGCPAFVPAGGSRGSSPSSAHRCWAG